MRAVMGRCLKNLVICFLLATWLLMTVPVRKCSRVTDIPTRKIEYTTFCDVHLCVCCLVTTCACDCVW